MSKNPLVRSRKTFRPDTNLADEDLSFPASMPTALAAPVKQRTKAKANLPESDNSLWGKVRSAYRSVVTPYWLYPHLQIFRREDVRFAIKVGVGAVLYAMFAFIPSTRDWYNHWHLEWALVTYMIVCAMNVGISNNMTWSRIYGTFGGAVLAIAAWELCKGNPFGLAVCGWLVSLIAFYYIVAGGQAPGGRFILLTYSLSVLYSYGMTISDKEGETQNMDSDIYHVVSHRVVAILLGCAGGLVVTRLIWPISARKKVRLGLSLLWLRMALVWKRGPLSVLTNADEAPPNYMDIRQEANLRTYVDTLDTLRKDAESEITLKGPFPREGFDALLKSTGRMLDAFHALNIVISKDTKTSEGETELLKYTKKERGDLARRISHLLSGTCKSERTGLLLISISSRVFPSHGISNQ